MGAALPAGLCIARQDACRAVSRSISAGGVSYIGVSYTSGVSYIAKHVHIAPRVTRRAVSLRVTRQDAPARERLNSRPRSCPAETRCSRALVGRVTSRCLRVTVQRKIRIQRGREAGGETEKHSSIMCANPASCTVHSTHMQSRRCTVLQIICASSIMHKTVPAMTPTRNLAHCS